MRPAAAIRDLAALCLHQKLEVVRFTGLELSHFHVRDPGELFPLVLHLAGRRYYSHAFGVFHVLLIGDYDAQSKAIIPAPRFFRVVGLLEINNVEGNRLARQRKATHPVHRRSEPPELLLGGHLAVRDARDYQNNENRHDESRSIARNFMIAIRIRSRVAVAGPAHRRPARRPPRFP